MSFSTTLKSSDYIYPVVLPWNLILSDLVQNGCSITLLAEITGKQRSSVQYWLEPQFEPKESIARCIITLHTRYCGQEMTEIRLQQGKQIE